MGDGANERKHIKGGVLKPALIGITHESLWALKLVALALLCAVPVLNIWGLAMVAARHGALAECGCTEAPLLRKVSEKELGRGFCLAVLEAALLVFLLVVLSPAFDAAQLDTLALRVEFIVFGAWPIPAATASAAGAGQVLSIAARLVAVYGTCVVSVVASGVCCGRSFAWAAVKEDGAKGRVFKATCLPLLAYTVWMLAVLSTQGALLGVMGSAAALVVLVAAALGIGAARVAVSSCVAAALHGGNEIGKSC